MGTTAVELAAIAEVAVVCVGNHPEGNASWARATDPAEGKESLDRKTIGLPHAQEDFIRRICAVNPRTIVVLIANFPIAMPWAAENAPAIIHLTHSSQEQGNALADVIFGVVNPGGKLTQTWPRSLEQLPPMMDYDIRHGRTYQYFTGQPQYPFGYGLSYTTFSLSDLQIDQSTLSAGARLTVSVKLTNTGRRDGDEVVQLYVRYPESKVSRPLKQLRGFRRVTLAAGATTTTSIPLAAYDLAYWDESSHGWLLEPGKIELLVGTSSADSDLPLRTTVVVKP
jgi:beta-glucosidase